jgi:hypothetical protein
MDDVVVFLGPTLPHEVASQSLRALYLPPAEQGSIFRVARSSNPPAIVLIDGAFGKVPAVRHKEILWALSGGIHVYGAASVGALRAAELADVGMRGYGLIYRWYRAAPFADDDEVAVGMTPSELGAQPLSEALINMRLNLRRAERAGLLPNAMRLTLEDVARSTYFPLRTYKGLFDRARLELPSHWADLIDPLHHWILHCGIDQKRADALGLLRWLANNLGSPAAQDTKPRQPFRMTEAWAFDLHTAGLDFNDTFEGSRNLPP